MASNKKCADGQQVKYKGICLFNQNVLLRLLFKIFFYFKKSNKRRHIVMEDRRVSVTLTANIITSNSQEST